MRLRQAIAMSIVVLGLAQYLIADDAVILRIGPLHFKVAMRFLWELDSL